MLEAYIPFTSQQLLVIAITAILFFIFGWWLRCKFNKCGGNKEELEVERQKSRGMEAKINEANARAREAEESATKARAEVKAKLVGMVPEAEVQNAKSAIADEQRKARDLQAQIQRSDDGHKALRNVELKMIELQNELSRSREETARLRDAGSNIAAVVPDADFSRLKESLRTAETLAGNERRRAGELEKEKTALTEQMLKAKDEAATLKAARVDGDAKAKLEADITAAKAASKIAEAALAAEKQRVADLERDYKNSRAQLTQARVEIQKNKDALAAASKTSAPAEPLDAVPVAEVVAPVAEIVADDAPAPKREKNVLATEVLGKRVLLDDLKIVEGIGPMVEELLNADGITTWEKLGGATAEQIKDILTRAGERFVMHDPTTWPRQALLAHESKWQELREWQDLLDGGKLPAIAS